jgi:hypothetical protein
VAVVLKPDHLRDLWARSGGHQAVIAYLESVTKEAT